MNLDIQASLILSVSIPVIFIGCTLYVFYLYRLLTYLKLKLPTQWQELGSPSIIANNSIQNNILLLKWLLSRNYLKLEDKKVTRLGERCRWLFIVIIPVLLITFIVVSFFFLS